MRFYLISDNHDTLLGMRLAGIEGIIVHEAQEVETAIKNAVSTEDIGILLTTESLVKLCHQQIYDIKLKAKRPLVVEIPGRHSAGRSHDSIMKYVREAIGVKL